MLASILPGLREIRAPLAAGYLWLFGIWLMLANSFLAIPRDQTIGGNLRGLLEYLGPVSTLAALSFVAYLLGLFLPSGRFILIGAANLISSVSTRYWELRRQQWQQKSQRRQWQQKRNPVRGRTDAAAQSDLPPKQPVVPQPKYRFSFHYRHGIFISKRLTRLIEGKIEGIIEAGLPVKELVKRYQNEFRADEPTDWWPTSLKDQGQRVYLTSEIHNRIFKDQQMLSEQLFSRNQEAYVRFDRLNSEAEFRGAIFLPLTFIATVLSHRFISENQQTYAVLTWVAYGLSAIALYRLRISAGSQSGHLVVTAILVGDIVPPEIAFLDQTRDTLRTQGGAGLSWQGRSQPPRPRRKRIRVR